jgi:MipA family protein
MAPQTRFLSHAPRALKRAVLSSAAVLCVSAPLSAMAAGPGGPGGPGSPGKDGESSWGLGIGAVSSQKAYTGYDRDTKVLPMLSYENRWVKLSGLGLTGKLPSWNINPSQRVEFGLVARLDLGGYEQDDAPILNGMAERKGGVWLGGKAEWKTDMFDLGGQWTADASGHSKGQKFELTLEKTWRLGGQVMLTPRLGAEWVDKKYVDYYYGVRAEEARAGRAFYQGKSTTNAEVGLRTMYLFDRHHAMLLDLSVKGLGSGIKDSTLVDRSTENRVFVGYQYRF